MGRAHLWFLIIIWLLCSMCESNGKAKVEVIRFKGKPRRGSANNTSPPLDFSYEKLLDTAITLIRAAKRTGPPKEDVSERIDEDEPDEDEEVGQRNHHRCPPRPIDCEELMMDCNIPVSGIYRIYPRSRVDTWGDGGFEVYCDMDTDGGGWTIIQKRDDYGASIDFFYKDWVRYKEGFGDLNYDYWLGNDKIFALSNQRRSAIRFDLFDFEGGKGFAVYDDFYIEDESQAYRLHLGDYRGDVGDSFSGHNRMKFTTKDRHNDNNRTNCAQVYKSGWWYNSCHTAHPNGLYLRGRHTSYANGIHWYTYKGFHYSLKRTEMKLRSADFARIFNIAVAKQETV